MQTFLNIIKPYKVCMYEWLMLGFGHYNSGPKAKGFEFQTHECC